MSFLQLWKITVVGGDGRGTAGSGHLSDLWQFDYSTLFWDFISIGPGSSEYVDLEAEVAGLGPRGRYVVLL